MEPEGLHAREKKKQKHTVDALLNKDFRFSQPFQYIYSHILLSFIVTFGVPEPGYFFPILGDTCNSLI